jgi:hypothetical protein
MVSSVVIEKQIVMPVGTKLVGHVAEATAKSKERNESVLSIV